jgi:hypothetical protein
MLLLASLYPSLLSPFEWFVDRITPENMWCPNRMNSMKQEFSIKMISDAVTQKAAWR